MPTKEGFSTLPHINRYGHPSQFETMLLCLQELNQFVLTKFTVMPESWMHQDKNCWVLKIADRKPGERYRKIQGHGTITVITYYKGFSNWIPSTYRCTQHHYQPSRPATRIAILSSVSTGKNSCSMRLQLKLRLLVYSRPLCFQHPVKSNQLACL